MRSTAAAVVVGVGVGVAAALASSEARACTCIAGWSLLDADAKEIPNGAPLVFASACGGSIGPWKVVIDGAPTTLGTPVPDGSLVRVPLGHATATGADVQVFLDCTMDELGVCAPGDVDLLMARYTVGVADTTAPTPPASVALTLPEDDAGTDCFAIDGKQRIDVGVEVDTREPFTWIELVVQVAGAEVERTTRPIPPSGHLDAVAYVDEGADDEEICVDAFVHDASGNSSTAVRECIVPAVDAEARGCSCGSGTGRAAVTCLVGVFAMILRRRRR